jgi:hypothetical protein
MRKSSQSVLKHHFQSRGFLLANFVFFCLASSFTGCVSVPSGFLQASASDEKSFFGKIKAAEESCLNSTAFSDPKNTKNSEEPLGTFLAEVQFQKSGAAGISVPLEGAWFDSFSLLKGQFLSPLLEPLQEWTLRPNRWEMEANPNLPTAQKEWAHDQAQLLSALGPRLLRSIMCGVGALPTRNLKLYRNNSPVVRIWHLQGKTTIQGESVSVQSEIEERSSSEIKITSLVRAGFWKTKEVQLTWKGDLGWAENPKPEFLEVRSFSENWKTLFSFKEFD